MKYKKLNPYKWKWMINILFLSILLFYLGLVIFELLLGKRNIDCTFTIIITIIIILQSWIWSIRPVLNDIEKLKKNERTKNNL